MWLGRVATALTVAALALGCPGAGGSSGGDLAPTPDTGEAADDVAPDSAPDAASDVAPDAATDASTDVAPSDATPDQPDSVEPDPVPLTEACRGVDLGLDLVPLAEVSGAAWMGPPQGPAYALLADSGHGGAGLWVQEGPWQLTPIAFPLDPAAGDDLEARAVGHYGRLVGLVSAGYVREWELQGSSLVQTRSAYPLYPDGEPWVRSDPFAVNQGKNYEALCLRPDLAADGSCAGFAGSKAEGELLCVTFDGASYVLDPTRRIGGWEPDTVSDCAFELEPPHRLVVAGNLYAASTLWEVRGWEAPATAELVELSITGPTNQEAIAFGPGGRLLSFGDVQDVLGEASPVEAFACHPDPE